MSSKFPKDLAGSNSDEARFLARVADTLESSLIQLPPALESRLDSARHAAMLQAWEMDGERNAAQANFGALLDSSAPKIPESVHLRLDAIRAQAMQRASAAQLKSQQSHPDVAWWKKLWPAQGFAVPVSAFASISVLVTTIAIFSGTNAPETMPLIVAENSLVLASEDEIELYENLEFYQWLAENGL